MMVVFYIVLNVVFAKVIPRSCNNNDFLLQVFKSKVRDIEQSEEQIPLFKYVMPHQRTCIRAVFGYICHKLSRREARPRHAPPAAAAVIIAAAAPTVA